MPPRKKEYAITVWLTETQLDLLREYCEYKGYFVSQFVRYLILQELSNFKKKGE